MDRRIIVSGGDQLREVLPGLVPGRRIQLEGSGAVCAGSGAIFCACSWDDTVWRLDSRRLIPTGLFAGGPGVSELLLSPDGKRLYALCGDADSVLMLSAETGAPMMVNRVGVNPLSMALDERGEMLVVAGGEYACTVLLDARTLDVAAQHPMPGIVCSVAVWHGTVYSLCLHETLSTELITITPGGVRRTLRLPGMPGVLLARDHVLLAATCGGLYQIDADGSEILQKHTAVGRAKKLLLESGKLLLCDVLGERLYGMDDRHGIWRPVMERATDAAVILEE